MDKRELIEKLSEETKKRLEKFPKLKRCVNDLTDDPYTLDMVTVYVRYMNVDEPSMFNWDEETAEDFFTWGHNSRYGNVFEPMLFNNFEEYLNIIMDEIDAVEEPDPETGCYKEDFVDNEELFGEEDDSEGDKS